MMQPVSVEAVRLSLRISYSFIATTAKILIEKKLAVSWIKYVRKNGGGTSVKKKNQAKPAPKRHDYKRVDRKEESDLWRCPLTSISSSITASTVYTVHIRVRVCFLWQGESWPGESLLAILSLAACIKHAAITSCNVTMMAVPVFMNEMLGRHWNCSSAILASFRIRISVCIQLCPISVR